jgi:very-short-patch-repair endonuclease/predicted transcriptional regulator of viral defense system
LGAWRLCPYMEQKRATRSIHRLVAELADGQHGVVGHAQLIELGLTAKQIQAWLAAGRLHRIYRGVYAVGRATINRRGWWMAATLTSGEGAVLSHASAAGLWNVISPRERVDVTVPTTAGRCRRKGLMIHRTSSLPTEELTELERIPVTGLARTLLDLSSSAPRRTLERALDEAEYLRLYDGRALQAVIEAHPARAHRLARVISEHVVGTTLTNKGFEEEFLLLCRRHRLPDPLVHVPIGPYEADFLWPRAMLIVETDDRSHRRLSTFERDHDKDAYLQDLGYMVRRVTWRQMQRDSDGVAERLAALIERRTRERVRPRADGL